MSSSQEQLDALRELVAAIAEIAARPFPAIGPDPDVTRHIEELRELQRDPAHRIASAAWYVTNYDAPADLIRSFARGMRMEAREPGYPAAPELESETEVGQ